MSIIENKDVHMDKWQQRESQIMIKYYTTIIEAMKKEVLDYVMLNSYMEQKSTNARRNDLIHAVEAIVKRGTPNKSYFK